MLATFVSSALNVTYPALVGKLIDSVVKSDASALRTIIFFVLGMAVLQSVLGFVQNFWMGCLENE